MIQIYFTPPYIYIILAIIFLLSTLLWIVRKRIFHEIKRWQLKEINLGPLKLEKQEAKDLNLDPTKNKKDSPLIPQQLPDRLGEAGAREMPIVKLPEKLYINLIGRENEIAEILNSLRDPIARRVVGVYGMGGIGKSSLVREVAGRAVDQKIFSAAWWTTTKIQSLDVFDEVSSEKNVSYAVILNRFVAWLGLSSELRTAIESEREVRIRKYLANSNFLLILDNLETSSDQDEIAIKFAKLILDTNCKILLTSREAWSSNSSAFIESIQLQGISEKAGVDLMRSIAREQRNYRVLSANDNQLIKIARAVKNMPLAIKLMVGLLQNHDLNFVLENLESIQTPKIIEMYEYLFASNWRSLSASEKKLLVALSKFDEDEGVNAEMLKKAKVVRQDDFFSAIDNLAKLSLIEIANDPNIERARYKLHPLTFNFIRSKHSLQ